MLVESEFEYEKTPFFYTNKRSMIMRKIFQYSFIVLFVIALISGGIYFYMNKDGYHVVFNSNGGSIVAPLNTGFKHILEKPEDPTREGYTFAGWYLGDEKFDFDRKINENITLTAHWNEIEETVYTLSFDSLGGSKIENIQITEGSLLEQVPNPVKLGYQFVGWYYHNKLFDFSSPVTQDMVFVAKYQASDEVITITFDTDGGSKIDDIEITSGEIPEIPEVPIWEGYTFAGWYLEGEEYLFDEKVYQDITLKAHWNQS